MVFIGFQIYYLQIFSPSLRLFFPPFRDAKPFEFEEVQFIILFLMDYLILFIELYAQLKNSKIFSVSEGFQTLHLWAFTFKSQFHCRLNSMYGICYRLMFTFFPTWKSNYFKTIVEKTSLLSCTGNFVRNKIYILTILLIYFWILFYFRYLYVYSYAETILSWITEL